MMATLDKICACFCVLYFCTIICSSNIVLEGGKSNTSIGENISVHAYVYYDTTNETMVNSSMKDYFVGIFSQVQQYFHNHSVMVNISVKDVAQKNFTVGYENEHFDYNKTLQNLTSYGSSLQRPNNSIFYYFTWTPYMFSGTFLTTIGRAGQSDFETNNTFCSNDTSGAVIRHNLTNDGYHTTVKATAIIFGSLHFMFFNDSDIREMNKTFSRCPKGDVPLPPYC
ncbi:uncharacterized protein LOC142768914 [Rhipicephalus microplus]|uniref:uncharacterized protein LOC142768914 n=1 Tax=Rhipicephalus microplus TaxID=6941 RepID=UPI003F6AF320